MSNIKAVAFATFRHEIRIAGKYAVVFQIPAGRGQFQKVKIMGPYEAQHGNFAICGGFLKVIFIPDKGKITGYY